jgi:hypothetical protein
MDLDNLLTLTQQEKLARLLAQTCECGHGSVTIRVVGGRPKFISVEYESKLDDQEVVK